MAARPIKAAAFGAHSQGAAGGARPFRHPLRRIRRRRLERPVVDGTAGERRVLPVEVESRAQVCGSVVDTVSRKHQDLSSDRDGRRKIPVLGQQDPMLLGAANGERPVGKPARGDYGIVSGRTQPSAEAVQHLIAQKPRHLPDSR